jgi:hypothetical protein
MQAGCTVLMLVDVHGAIALPSSSGPEPSLLL